MSTATSLFQPSLNRVEVSRKVLEPLLDKSVTFTCSTKDHVQLSVTVRVEEIFQKFKAEINLGYAKCKMEDVHFAGSSVSSLWSKEEFSDIDIHGLIDLRGTADNQRFRETNNVEWILLQVILDTIKPQVPPENFSKINKESFLYTKKVAFLNARNGPSSLPFNVLSLSVGTPPIEFSVWCLFEEYSGPPIRRHDFNTSALKLRSIDSDTYILTSSSGEVMQTLVDISRGELNCYRPEELKDKGLSRYLSKVIRSGYTDLDPSLFGKLFSAGVIRSSELESPLTPELFINQLKFEFNRSSQDTPIYRTILLHLWFMKSDEEPFLRLNVLAKNELIRIFSAAALPLDKEMHDLVLNDKRSELAWLLLCMCDTYKEINYRGEESLQLTFSFPSEESHKRKLYLPLPMRGLARFKEAMSPETFLSNEFTKVSPGRISGEYLEGLFEIANKLFSNEQNFPILFALTHKFQLRKSENYLSSFVYWASSLPDQKKKEIPEEILKNVLEGIKEESSFSDQKALLDILYIRFGSSEEILEWQTTSLQSEPISLMVIRLIKQEEFSSLELKTQELCFAIAKSMIHKLFTSTESASTLYAKDPAGCKRTLSLVYKLYKSGRIPLGLAVRGMQFCTDCSLYESSAKFLKEFWDKKESSYVQLLPIALNLAKANFSVYVNALCSNKEPLDSKVREYFIFEGIAALLEQEDPDIETAKKLVLEANAILAFEDKVALASRILENSDHVGFASLFTHVVTEYKLSVASFSNIEDLDRNQLVLLENQPDFESVMHSNVKFAKRITKRAGELHLDSILTQGLKVLARVDPLSCIELMQIPSFESDLTDASFSICVDLWITILKGIPEGQEDLVRRSLMRQLDIFKSHMDRGSHDDFMELIDQVRKLHKEAVYFTLDSEFWPQIWAIAKQLRSSYKSVSDWVDLPDAKVCAAKGAEKIPIMLSAFTFDADSALKWANELLADGKYPKDFAYINLSALLSCFNEIDSKILKPSSIESIPIAWNVFDKIPSYDRLSNFSARKTASDYALFCMTFGDASIRSRILDYYSNPLFTAPVTLGGIFFDIHPFKERDVGLLALLRAWQSNKHSELVSISESHFVWRSKNFNVSIAREICHQSTEYMKKIFESKDEPTRQEQECIFSSYFHFFYFQKLQIETRLKELKSLEKSDSESLEFDQLDAKEEVENLSLTIDDSICRCLEHIKKVKKISYLHAFIYHMQSVLSNLSPEVRDRIGKLLIEAAVDCLEADKKVEPTDIFYVHLQGLYKHISVISGRSLSTKLKIRLMNQLIDAFSRYITFESVLDNNPERISLFFQCLVVSLTKEELDDFFIAWVQKIALDAKALSDAENILFMEFLPYKIIKTGDHVLIKNRSLLLDAAKTMALEAPSQQKAISDFIHQIIPTLYSAVSKPETPQDIRKPFRLEMFSFCLLYFKQFPHSQMFTSISVALFVSFFGKRDSDGVIVPLIGSEKKHFNNLVQVIENIKVDEDFRNSSFVKGVTLIKSLFDSKIDSFRDHLSPKHFAFLKAFFDGPHFARSLK